MKHFVVHDPKLLHRREFLEKHLQDRGVTDVEWVTDLNFDSKFIKWLHQRTQTPMAPGYLSCSVKHYSILSHMVTRGIQEAVILEDDVVLHEDYAKFTPIFGLKFIKLGIGVNWTLNPGMTPVQTPNFGCSEAQYITLDMAKYILENLHFGHCVDIVYWAILTFVKHPLVTVPLAHQTSILEGSGTTGQSESKKEMPLGNYIHGWNTLPKFKWVDLIKEFENISKVEDEFERNFGKRIQLVNAEYIRHRDVARQ
jgi:GR25 family glycosyltransferase involved in LPS biosynthesis